MFSGSKKPYTAVTVAIDRLTSESYEEDDISGIPDLVEVIRIQASGPTEAARAIRKKLKYGNPHRQIRALVILDGLIENAGSRFQRTFADEPLLERLRLMARDDVVEAQVRQKCKVLFLQWANGYKNKPGMERIANLYKEFPKTQRPAAARQKVLQDTEVAEPPSPPPQSPSTGTHSRSGSSSQAPPRPSQPSRPVTLTPTSSSFSSKLFKDKKSSSGSSGKPFNLSREKENITNTLAKSSMAATNLLNGLQLINRETQRVSENPEILSRFETCKQLRRQILYYIQRVESDDWIGSLVNANDELVKALTAFEIMDRSISDDSDSENDSGALDHNGGSGSAAAPTVRQGRGASISQGVQQQLAGLSIASSEEQQQQQLQPPTKPPRPGAPGAISLPKPPVPQVQEDEDDDEDNPFGDSNAVGTPFNERPGMTWKEV